MAAYANGGDISKAVAAYDRLAQGLQKDLGVKPSEQTQALYKRIKAGWKPDALKDTTIQEKEPPLTPTEKVVPTFPLPKSGILTCPTLTSFIGRERKSSRSSAWSREQVGHHHRLWWGREAWRYR
jgi:hypothetical protein